MLKDLREKGLITDEQLKPENFGNHICNADEVGGRESGKRKKVYKTRRKKPSKKRKRCKSKKKNWRNIQVGDDHNPFHVSKMLLSFGNDKVSNAIGVLHSTPGSKNPRQNDEHKKGLHPDWWQATTKNGSMTWKTFEQWCYYLVQVKKTGLLSQRKPPDIAHWRSRIQVIIHMIAWLYVHLFILIHSKPNDIHAERYIRWIFQ